MSISVEDSTQQAERVTELTPPPPAASSSGASNDTPTASAPSNNSSDGIWGKFKVMIQNTGVYVLRTMEAVGESVAWFIGLDQSRFQYIIDEMSEEELAVAKMIHEKRSKELQDHINQSESKI